jgi:hypothetical protein
MKVWKAALELVSLHQSNTELSTGRATHLSPLSLWLSEEKSVETEVMKIL